MNLLSPWVFDAIANRRLRQRFVGAACVLALLLGAGWCVQYLRATQAEQILGIEKAESARLTSQTQALAPVRVFVSSVEQQKVTVIETMRSEVQFSEVLESLAVATPVDAEVQSISATLTPPAQVLPGADPSTVPPAASACPGPDPFNTRTVVGCVTLSGSAANRSAVGEFVVNLGDSKLFVEPFIATTTTADGERVTFTGSVGLSEQVFSNRYADLDALLKSGVPQ